ncbi:MAG: aminotransferase class III-fold pyridoxal phosphate-dependent enzyme [Gemmatimonadaceae bacterium]
MPFRRFFERGAKRETPTVDNESPADDAEAEADAESIEENAEVVDDYDHGDVGAPEDAEEIDWRSRANAVLPTGASTGSKRVEALYGDAEATGPTHYQHASGCRVVDSGGRSYVDCTMALGAVALGYAEPEVQRAAMIAIAGGNVSALSDVREVDLAERLREHILAAEMVQFVKTGAEGVSAAIRIARTYTGRDMVLGCGYFGWHDWASDAAGVPEAVRSLYRTVPFDDRHALGEAAHDVGDRLAAIVIEPVIERMPSNDWITEARGLAETLGAVLIFDEMKTGFRVKTGGFQALSGVTPDLAIFGKAMANGFPLAAVVGRRDVMEAARRTWISSTLAGESVGLAAAGAVLDAHESTDICAALATTGAAMRASIQSALEASGIEGVSIEGLDQMWFLRFGDKRRETRFLELAASHGVLFKRGAYNFPAMAHDEETISEIESAASAAFVELLEEEQGRA